MLLVTVIGLALVTFRSENWEMTANIYWIQFSLGKPRQYICKIYRVIINADDLWTVVVIESQHEQIFFGKLEIFLDDYFTICRYFLLSGAAMLMLSEKWRQ